MKLITSAQFARMIDCTKSAFLNAVSAESHDIPKHTAELARSEKTIIKLWSVKVAENYIKNRDCRDLKPYKTPKKLIEILYRKNFRSSDIAAKIGVSPETVNKIAISNNIKRTEKISFFTPAYKIDRVISAMYTSEETASSI